MKKIIVTLVAMMAVTFSFAETNSNNVDRRFDMSCNMDNHSQQLQHRVAVTGLRKRTYPETPGASGSKKGCSEDEERAEREAVWTLHAHHAEHPAQQTPVKRR